MIKLTVFFLIFFLIVSTSLIKKSTKDLDDEIYFTNENLLFLESRFKDAKLELLDLEELKKLHNIDTAEILGYSNKVDKLNHVVKLAVFNIMTCKIIYM